ncbi:MAG: NADPH-dependent FMN reductase [Armatimonadota bacterium]
MDTIHVLGFAGSLRKGSYNKALLRAAIELAPPDVEIEVFDIAVIPFYNQDEDDDQPAPVKDFKARIRAADAVLIVTPEYNYSMPGVLKNAIDCASRPYGDNAFQEKPIAFMGATVGLAGTARAQYHLRQCCVFLEAHPLNMPEVLVAFCADKFDANGRFTDEEGRGFIRQQLEALAAWTRRLRE